MAEIYLSIVQVAQRYNVHRSTPWRWVHVDPSFPRPITFTSGCTRWRQSDLIAWEAARAGDARR